jgi:hypothetical protein
MFSEQTTSQIEVVEPKVFKTKNYKKLFCKEKERNDILETNNKYLFATINVLECGQNKIHELEAELEQKNNEIEKLKLKLKKISLVVKLQPLIEDNITEKQCSNDEEFWQGFIEDPNLIKKKIEYLLEQFGTKEPCNRFDVGNSIEFIICDYIKSCGFEVLELPNAKRFDIDIVNYKKLSIKYSSTGDITLHNSNSSINRDIDMKDTILLTPDKLYLITNTELCKNNININDYTQNTGDSLKLRRKLLKELEDKNYPYMYEINIKHNKKECKNRLCSKIFYAKFNEEYESSLK